MTSIPPGPVPPGSPLPHDTSAGRLLLTGRVVGPESVVTDAAVAVEAGRIVHAGPRRDLPEGWQDVPAPDGWDASVTLLPGLVDLHCHGGAGGEFGPDPQAAARAVDHHHRSGSTSVVASVVSAPGDALVRAVTTLAPLSARGDLAALHLEGPFLSTVRCGAQDPAALVDVDLRLVEALVTASRGTIGHMTFAPERPRSGALVDALAAADAVAAVGHTDADFRTVAAALEAVRSAGARGGRALVTHLFNGMPPLHHRSPGPAAAALAAAGRGEAVVELIADGVHLDGGTVRMVFDTVGPAGVALVSDAMAAAGLADGPYTLGGQAVTVRGREARLTAGGSIAGGVSTLLEEVRWCVLDLGIDLHDAVTAASRTPAAALALDDVGALSPGRWADVVVVDDGLVPQRVLRRGTWLSPPA